MRRILVAPLVAAATVALVSIPVPPASAKTVAAVSIKVNETKLIHGGPIQGVSTQFQAANRGTPVANNPSATTPADCEAEPAGCETTPLTLDVPEDDPDLLEASAYLLTVVLSWDSGQAVENLPEFGTQRQNDLEGYLYQDPQVRSSSGGATFTSSSHNNNPAELTAVAPTSKKFKIVVANFSGINNGYTLQISLIKSSSIDFDPSQFGPRDVPGYVQPPGPPPSTTPRGSGFGGSDVPPISPSNSGPTPSVGGTTAIVVPNVANGRPDATLLAMSQTIGATGLGRRAVAVSSTVISDKVTQSSDSKVLLALLALPLLAVVSALLLLFRRKRAAGTPATSVA